jgi:signal peptidase I
MENDLEDFHSEVAPEQTAPQKSKSGARRFLIDVLETLVLSVLLFAAINVISARIRVDGYSMEPNLHSGEFVIVNKLTYKFGSPQIGDVVVFHFISNKQVKISGQVLDEPYIAAAPLYESSWTVTEDSLFVLGDNRNNSSDSHNWGLVPQSNVVGKAVFIYWPPTEWGLVDHITPVFAQ